MPEKNAIIVSESGNEYRVLELISSGTGQGDVYKVIGRDKIVYAMKLFYDDDASDGIYGNGSQVVEGSSPSPSDGIHQPQYNARLMRQMKILMRRGRACPEYVHPLEIVRYGGRCGYIMEYVPDSYLCGSVLYNGYEHDGTWEALPFATKLSFLYNIAEAVGVLYNAELAMMDLKFDNIRVDPETCGIKIIDTDTIVYTREGDPLIDGTVGFMPPLTMLSKEKPTKYNDSYALAVMIFMTLIGIHPLMGRAADKLHDVPLERYMFGTNPIYVFSPTDKSNRPGEDGSDAVKKYEKYPDCFKEAMEKTFTHGLYEKEMRTTPNEWCDILKEVYRCSYICAECGEEQFITSNALFCDACGCELKRPLWLCGEKKVPLFLGMVINDGELWEGISNPRDIFTVVKYDYGNKCGFLSQDGETLLRLDDERTITFPAGRAVPLILNGTYIHNNKSYRIEDL